MGCCCCKLLVDERAGGRKLGLAISHKHHEYARRSAGEMIDGNRCALVLDVLHTFRRYSTACSFFAWLGGRNICKINSATPESTHEDEGCMSRRKSTRTSAAAAQTSSTITSLEGSDTTLQRGNKDLFAMPGISGRVPFF